MGFLATWTFTLVVFAILKYLLSKSKKSRELPPGPLALPGLLGNIIQLAGYRHKESYLVCHELNQRYGPTMSIRIGVLNQVITCDFDLMREILTSDDFEDRFYNDYVGLRSYGKPLGILLGTGDSWAEMRRFTMKTLREFGIGRPQKLKPMIEEEIYQILGSIRMKETTPSNQGVIINFKHFFTPAIINLLWKVMVGQRFCPHDPKLQKLINMMDELVKINPAFVNISMAFPFLSPLTRLVVPQTRRMVKCTKTIQDFLQGLLLERRALGLYLDQDCRKENFVDAFLIEIDKRKNEHPNYYTDEQFVIVALDLFMAGSETTSSMLEWAVYFMVLYPRAQAKVQDEIDSVVGGGRIPNYGDRLQMAYTQAVLLEIQRLANVNPQNVRSPIRDTKIGNYFIPKGSFTVINTYSYNLNEAHWSEPLSFKPERFLGPDGKILNSSRLLTFGLGKRACPGDSLAKMSIFMFLTSLLQSYRLEASPNHQLPSISEPISGTTLAPQPFYVRLTPRKRSAQECQ